jgi:hypothetical protein
VRGSAGHANGCTSCCADVRPDCRTGTDDRESANGGARADDREPIDGRTTANDGRVGRDANPVDRRDPTGAG